MLGWPIDLHVLLSGLYHGEVMCVHGEVAFKQSYCIDRLLHLYSGVGDSLL